MIRAGRRRLIIAVLLTLPLVTVALLPIPATASAGSTPRLVISAPQRATAGARVGVRVSGAPENTVVSLTLLTSAGSFSRRTAVNGGAARFELGPDLTAAAGQTTLIARADGGEVQGRLSLVPGTAVGPITAVVGARSIVADGGDRSMAVSMPADVFGNSIADGSVVGVVRRRPDGRTEDQTVFMSHLLAWAVLRSGTRAGRGAVWIQAGTATGPTSDLDEVAAPPVPFTLDVVDPPAAAHTGADGQTPVYLRTSAMHDRFGNLEPDGTLVTIAWSGSGGASQSSAVTIGGVARFSVIAPSVSGQLTVTGACRGTASMRPLKLSFGPVIARIGVVAQRSAAGIGVTIGPVRRVDGPYALDGTFVDVAASDAAGHHAVGSGQLVRGTLTLLLPDSLAPGAVKVRVSVLGSSQSVDLP